MASHWLSGSHYESGPGMECPLNATADAADRLRSLDAVLCLTEDPELRRLGLPRDGDARTYIKPMLRRPAA